MCVPARSRLGDVLQARGELGGHTEQLLVLRPQLLVVLQQAAVLVPDKNKN